MIVDFKSRSECLKWAKQEFTSAFYELFRTKLDDYDGPLEGECFDDFIHEVKKVFREEDEEAIQALATTPFSGKGRRIIPKFIRERSRN